MPPLPVVATASFLPAIRSVIDTASQDASAKPFDAAVAGRFGMVLHAHDQLAAAAQAYWRAAHLEPRNPDWPYYRGVTLASQGDHVQAVELFRRALSLSEADIAIRRRLADSLLAGGQNQLAAREYQAILNGRPDDPAALFGLGRALSQPDKYERAIALFPPFGAAIFALAQHYQREGRAAEAAKLMASYPRHKTTSPPVDDPRMDAVAALNRGPSALLRQAIALEAKGRLAEAAARNEDALRLDPNLTQAHINLLSAYGRLGDPARAESHYRSAIAQNPNAADAHYNFGVLCLETRRPGDATAAFKRTIAIDPAHAGAHSNLGSILAAQGNLAAAASRFRKAIELQPDFRSARFQLGRVLANQNQYAAAMEQFQQAAAVEDAETPSYLYALGAVQARGGQTGLAAATLFRARELAVRYSQTQLAASITQDLASLKR